MLPLPPVPLLLPLALEGPVGVGVVKGLVGRGGGLVGQGGVLTGMGTEETLVDWPDHSTQPACLASASS